MGVSTRQVVSLLPYTLSDAKAIQHLHGPDLEPAFGSANREILTPAIESSYSPVCLTRERLGGPLVHDPGCDPQPGHPQG